MLPDMEPELKLEDKITALATNGTMSLTMLQSGDDEQIKDRLKAIGEKLKEEIHAESVRQTVGSHAKARQGKVGRAFQRGEAPWGGEMLKC